MEYLICYCIYEILNGSVKVDWTNEEMKYKIRYISCYLNYSSNKH